MTTLDDVTKTITTEPTAEAVAAKEWVRLAREQGLALDGPDGLLGQFTKSFLETALNEEMTGHLGHEKHRAPEDRDDTNVRNASRPKRRGAISPPRSAERQSYVSTPTMYFAHPIIKSSRSNPDRSTLLDAVRDPVSEVLSEVVNDAVRDHIPTSTTTSTSTTACARMPVLERLMDMVPPSAAPS